MAGEVTLNSIADGGIGGSAKYAGNVPLGDAAAMRVVAYYTQYGGYMDAVQPDLRVNDNVNTGSRVGARLAFRFEPSSNFRITPRLLYQEVEMEGWNRADKFNILANPYTTSRPAVTLGDRDPKSVPCGPRSTSTRERSKRSTSGVKREREITDSSR